jgi:hypothetical protein
MEKEQKLQIVNEIKRIERELYLKRSQLASAEAMEPEEGVYEGLDSEEWKKVFSELIEQIGRLSTGGNSVEDIRKERER